MAGLDAVIASGVPSILIHQLYLLPGTEMFEQREQLGIRMLAETAASVSASERSDYFDYLVISHPKMSYQDMHRGACILGINHLLHNHDLGRVVGFYLSRYGISHGAIYEFFVSVLMGDVENFRRYENSFYLNCRNLILDFSERTGLDEFLFYRRLSEAAWFEKRADGPSISSEPMVRAFMHDFFEAFRSHADICHEPWETSLLHELVEYNFLIAPKPAWTPQAAYYFEYDVHAIWE